MTNVEVLSYEDYFGGMPISEEEKKRRIAFAKQMEELFVILFVLMRQQNFEYYDPSSTEQRIRDVLEDNGISLTKTMETLIIERVDDIISKTLNHSNDAWYTSHDRAVVLAEEETNTFLNRDAFDKAKQSGLTRKKWVTMKDNKVRNTHYDVDDEIIPIDADFVVGSCLMAFPRDTKGDPEEIAGCRCGIEYLL